MKIISDTSDVRLDNYLCRAVAGYSRGYFQRLIKGGQATVNGKAVSAHYAVKAGDEIEFTHVCEEKQIAAEDIPLDVLHEDDDIIVVNKAPGMVVHPACGHQSGTLLNALMGRGRGSYTPLLVHRLDKDTSGVMVVARSERAKNSLVKQFQNRRVKKLYLVAVRGCVAENKGRIDAPLGRSPEDRKKIVVGPLSKKMAVTEFTVARRGRDFSLLEVRPVTGRTHQIRSHMVFIGHPVLGDQAYGGPVRVGEHTFARQMLHAYRIAFTHPSTGKNVEYAAPLPADIAVLWKELPTRSAPEACEKEQK
ncbi:MAG: RluA family pseudouridine synthase [Endomicrobiales bacterium]